MTTIRRNFANAAVQTQLDGAITASSTDLQVVSASNYPDPPFTIRVDNEAILVGGKSGTIFNTLTRGYDDTTAATHINGANVVHAAVAADFRNKWLDVIVTDDAVTAFDDEFDNPGLRTWSEVTPSGSATWTEARGVCSCIYSGQSTNDMAARLTSLDGLTYPLYTVGAIRTFGRRANYQMAGIAFADGTLSTSTAVAHSFYRGAFDYYVQSLRRGTFTNFNAQTEVTTTDTAPWLFMRLDWESTNTWQPWWSPDGVSWSTLGQSSLTYTLTPTHYGLVVGTWSGSNPAIATFEFFRTYTSKPSYWVEG